MNSKLKIGLVMLTIGLWSLIGYRIYSHVAPDEGMASATHVVHDLNDTLPGEEKYTLNLHYTDPFMKTPFSGGNHTGKKKIKSKLSPLAWPVISYKGQISGGSKKLAIVDINGKELLMHIRASADSIFLIQFYKDSALFQYRKEKKMIHKNK